MVNKKINNLQSKKKDELLDYARKSGLNPRKSWTKRQLIEYIQKNISTKKTVSEKKSPSKMRAKQDQDLRDYQSRSQPGSIPPVTSQGDTMTDIEKSKFDVGVTETPAEEEDYPIPEKYAEDKLVLLPRDPSWIFSYWEITSELIDRVQKKLGNSFSHAKPTLRIHMLKNNKKSFFDIDVYLNAKNWYVNVPEPDVEYTAELGFKYGMTFHPVLRSNSVRTPAVAVSEKIDERWMIVENMFKEIYGIAVDINPGTVSSFQFKQKISEMFQEVVSSGEIISGSPGKKAPVSAKDFRFTVDTELILYGQTEPGANVTVKGEPVYLRPDGTFTLRFALPDGHFPLECTARSQDGKKMITITPVVTRKTE